MGKWTAKDVKEMTEEEKKEGRNNREAEKI